MSGDKRVSRRWSIDDKRRIVAEASLPWTSVREVGKHYGLDPAQIYDWRKKFPDTQGEVDQSFLPAEVVSEPIAEDGPAPSLVVSLAAGHRLQVGRDADPALLRTALTKLAFARNVSNNSFQRLRATWSSP